MTEYDVSYIRHESGIAIDNILQMNVGSRALLRLEGQDKIDKERIERYRQRVLEELGSESERYVLLTKRIDRKWALIIERKV